MVPHNKAHSPGEELRWWIWFCPTQAGGNSRNEVAPMLLYACYCKMTVGIWKPKLGPKVVISNIHGKKLSSNTAEIINTSKAWLFYK